MNRMKIGEGADEEEEHEIWIEFEEFEPMKKNKVIERRSR